MRARTSCSLYYASVAWLALAAALSVLSIDSSADAATYNVSASVNGNYQQIGTIDANYVNYASLTNGQRAEEGVFQLNAQNKYLMNDVCNCEFRWFQVVTQDTDPINYLGNLLNAPYTDPPSSGWDYQRTPQNDWQNGQPGADVAPFYENDDAWVGTPKYPRYSGVLEAFGGNDSADAKIHDDTTGTLRTQDVPGTSNGNSVKFWTYLAYMNSTMKAAKEFALLWGYSWGVNVAANGTFTYDAIAELNGNTLVDDLVQGDIINALSADGFSSWTPVFRNVDLICVPEPASFVLILIGCCAFVAGRQRKRT